MAGEMVHQFFCVWSISFSVCKSILTLPSLCLHNKSLPKLLLVFLLAMNPREQKRKYLALERRKIKNSLLEILLDWLIHICPRRRGDIVLLPAWWAVIETDICAEDPSIFPCLQIPLDPALTLCLHGILLPDYCCVLFALIGKWYTCDSCNGCRDETSTTFFLLFFFSFFRGGITNKAGLGWCEMGFVLITIRILFRCLSISLHLMLGWYGLCWNDLCRCDMGLILIIIRCLSIHFFSL